MPSTFSPDLRIELMANGGNTGTWGTITNTNLGTLIEDAISGLASVSITSAAQALTVQDGAADQARCAAFDLTTTTTAAFSAFVPPVTKLYVVKNSSIYTATVFASTVSGNTTAAGTGVAIPAGRTVAIRCDGTNIVDQLNYISSNLTVGGNQAVTGTLTVTGASTFTGIPTGPTAVLGTNTTQLATTAFANASAAQAAGSALQDPGGNGLVVRTASTVTTSRSIVGSATVSVSNGDGVAGNPTLSIPAGAITATQLAAGAVTASSISSATIDAIKLTGGQSGSAPAYALRAWCQYTAVGGVTVPTGTGNIASITYNGAGNYTVTFTTAMQDTAYSAVGSTYYGAALGVYSLVFTTYNFQTTGFQVLTYINGQNVYQMANATPMSVMVVR